MDKDQPGDRDTAPLTAGALPRGRASVVVVDDRSSNRNILARLAGELGEDVRVSAFAGPGEALDAVTRAPPDLIITDYKMPEMSGGAFVRRLRTCPGVFDVPIIVVTAYEDTQYRYDALQAGASDFLLTPVDRFEFVQRARNLLTMRWQQKRLDRRAKARERRQRMKARRRERELHFNEAKFRLVVNALPALIRVEDSDGRVTFANAYHRSIFGLDPQAAAGRPVPELLSPEHARQHTAANADALARAAHITFEECIETGETTPRTFLSTKVPLAIDGAGEPHVVTISIDISAQKRAERQAAEAKELAQQANTAKTEFLARMSHELRTPLNAILGFADVTRQELMGPLGTDRYREYQEDIHASAEMLLRLIDDLLDVSKLELGKLETRAEPVDPHELVEGEIRTQTGSGRQATAAISCQADPELGTVTTDPLRLRQIVSNLLSNAIKYTPPTGHIAVRLAPSDGDGSGLRLTVTDDGPGMTRAQINTALSRFGRVQHSEDREAEGVGLGLPIAHDLADALGGRLVVDSAPGRGTAVTVDLPDLAGGETTGSSAPAEDAHD